jgi:hypothetical protein
MEFIMMRHTKIGRAAFFFAALCLTVTPALFAQERSGGDLYSPRPVSPAAPAEGAYIQEAVTTDYVGTRYAIIMRNVYEYRGGANGIPTDTIFVLDLVQGKLLSLADVVNLAPAAQITEILRTALRYAYAPYDGFLDAPDAETLFPPPYFRPAPEGLALLWPSTTIAPHYLGPIRVTIPWLTLAPYLTDIGYDMLGRMRR